VGRGTSGVVYRARRQGSDAEVALKVLRNAESGLGEAEHLKAIVHPNIVRILDAGTTTERVAYIAMEWLNGEDLATRLKRGPLPAVGALRLLAALAAGLGAAHRSGVFHRDIKPANIFLCAEGGDEHPAPKVLDFGSAMRASVSSQPDLSVVGTPAYMAPEQVRGDFPVGTYSDVFGLGVVAYELFAGAPPHAGSTYFSTLARLATTRAPRLRASRPEVSAELDALVHQMLSLDPTERPQDMLELEREFLSLSGRRTQVSWFELEPRSVRLGSSASRLVTTLVASGFPSSETLQVALNELREREADAVPIGQHSIVAHFGAQRARGNEAESALELGVSLGRLGAQVGVASGRQVVPYVEHDQAVLPIGEVVDRATALSRQAKRGEVLTEETTRSLSPRVHFNQVTAQIFRVCTEETIDGHFTVRPLSLESRFVGRSSELAQLVGVFTSVAAASRAAMVCISGAPGLGKSRLLVEASKRIQRDDVDAGIVLQRNDPYGQRRALGTALDVVRTLLAVSKVDSTATVLRAALAKIGHRLSADLRSRVEVFASLIASQQVPIGAETGATRDLVWVLMTLVVECSLVGNAIVIASEDVQWADVDSLNWFAHVLERCADHRLLLIITARPEFLTNHTTTSLLAGKLRIELRPVSDRATEAIVESTAREPLSSGARARIVEQAAGSPLFAEELTRLAAAGADVTLAPTIEAAIQVSLDALTETQSDAVGRLSVLGATIWDAALPALGVEEPKQMLQALTDLDILVQHTESRFAGLDERQFKHSLVRDVAYARLGIEQRRELHHLCAEWLERTGEDAAIVARHFDLAQLPERAALHWAIAAERALGANALLAAQQMAERSLTFSENHQVSFQRARLLDEIWQRLDARASDRETAICAMEQTVHSPESAVYAEGARARYDAVRGQGVDIEERLAQVRGRAGELRLYDEEARVCAELASRHAFAGRFAEAQKEAARLLSLAESRGVRSAAVDAWQTLAIVFQSQGELGRALDARRSAAHAAREAALRERESVLLTNLGFALTTFGAKDEAREMLEEGLRLASSIGSPGARRHALMLTLCWAGTFGSDASLNERLAELRSDADEAATFQWTAQARENLGVLFYRALDLLQQAAAVAETASGRSPLLERARILLQMSARAYRTTGNRDVLPVALGLWGRAEFACGNLSQSVGLLEEASSLLMEGSPSLLNESPVFLALHDAYQGAGSVNAAQESVARALPFLSRRARGLEGTPYRRSFLTELKDNARLLALALSYGFPLDSTLTLDTSAAKPS
jgi:tetratricopeptide (TPR) repeat protein